MQSLISELDRDYARRCRDEMRAWLEEKDFTHFVTLSFNEPSVGKERMRRALKEWDARTNRRLLGKRWRKKTDERLNWIAFPEKQEAHPHWHLLLQILDEQVEPFNERAGLGGRFEDILETTWKRLAPAGSADIQCINSKRVVGYTTKQLHDPENYQDYVTFRDFFEL